IARRQWRLPERLVRFIPNGVRPERFQGGDGGAFRAALGIPAGTKVVGSVGHLRPVKNLARLLAAAHRMTRPVHVLLVGDGPERAALEAQAAAAPPAGGG